MLIHKLTFPLNGFSTTINRLVGAGSTSPEVPEAPDHSGSPLAIRLIALHHFVQVSILG